MPFSAGWLGMALIRPLIGCLACYIESLFRISPSNTWVLPLGLMLAKPSAIMVPTRQTYCGKALLMCSRNASGILLIRSSLSFNYSNLKFWSFILTSVCRTPSNYQNVRGHGLNSARTCGPSCLPDHREPVFPETLTRLHAMARKWW